MQRQKAVFFERSFMRNLISSIITSSIFVYAALFSQLLIVSACATSGKTHSSPDLMAEQWGVKVLRISLSAEGYMLDFRYRVLDAEKAAPLFERKNKAYLVDQASGAKFQVPESPKVGALRTTRPPERDKNYFVIFANPGRYVKKGNTVTVVIGDIKIENLVVE